MIKVPEMLNLPKKMMQILCSLNKYTYFYCEGGRGSGKSHSIARIILLICEKRHVRVVCGREIQKSIDQSVYTLFCDLISKYNLDFAIGKNEIINRKTGSTIKFMGFREQGRVSIKGLEGVDILWIDEAEAITKTTLDVIIPTIRKDNAKIFFTMNRYVRNDAVHVFCSQKSDCYHIHINYYDNQFCPEKTKKEAKELKQKNIKDYNHIYLGEPLSQTKEYLFNSLKLERAEEIKPNNQIFNPISCMSVDLAAGGDRNVAKLVVAIDGSNFEEIKTEIWVEEDTDITIGKIVSLYKKWEPKISTVDGGGLGLPIYNTLSKVIKNLIKFDGAAKSNQENAANARADGYLILKDIIDNEHLKINDKEAIAQLEYIKKIYLKNGKIAIQDKKEMREEQGESPDNADSLMMNIYALNYFSYLASQIDDNADTVQMKEYDPFSED